MIIFPAIDLMGGRCVRLRQGKEGTETVYSDNPAQMALKWESMGARWLHVVDLDAALEKGSDNVDAACEIAKAVSIPVELGGGVRGSEKIRMLLERGISRVVIGTRACEKAFLESVLTEFGDRVAVGIDARDGKVAVRGWVEVTDIDAIDFARQVEQMGGRTIIFTDISTDGMLTGPNIPAIERMARAVNIDVIASGGVSKIEDITALKKIEPLGVTGVIVGKAIYSGSVDLEQAIRVAEDAH